jgi:hypothetical protein
MHHSRAIIVSTAVSLAMSGATSVSAATNTVVATSSATIYTPITLTALLNMDFATIVANSTGGAIVLDPVTNISCATGMTCLGTGAPATLTITASDASAVVVTYPPSAALISPGLPMAAAIQFPGGSGTSVPLVGGSATIKFGATLNVNPNQTPGTYSGLFSVTVDYP